jgi:hypothetical protein
MAPTRPTLLALLTLIGCAEPTVGPFIGDLATSNARVGVALGETSVTVLFVGQGEALQTHTRWFEAALVDQTWDVVVDGWRLVGEEDNEGIFGDLIDPQGVTVPWLATRPVDLKSTDGVYSSDAGACRSGGIVYNSGGQVAGVYCPDADTVVEVLPIALTGPDVVLEAQTADGPVEFTATPVQPD